MNGFLTTPTTAGLDSDKVLPVVTVADPRMWPHLRPKGAPGRKGEVEGVVTEPRMRFGGWWCSGECVWRRRSSWQWQWLCFRPDAMAVAELCVYNNVVNWILY
jgi:hypothetical protein